MKENLAINIIFLLIGISIGVLGSDYAENKRIDFFGYAIDKEPIIKFEYERAESFFESENYDAAIILYERIIADYPETIYAEMSKGSIEVAEILKESKKIRLLLEEYTK